MSTSGTLYLFPVLLGGSDVGRALPQYNTEVLKRVRYFIVENLRSARRFLKMCDRGIDIDSLNFVELNEHTPLTEIPAMLRPLEEGNDVGVISEAGCPAVADPGADVVALAQRKGIKVVPLVGPSSILLSLMGSGFNGQRFAFGGYLPIDGKARQNRLNEMVRRIMREDESQIFIETPYRNNRLINELCATLPGHLLLCVASGVTTDKESILAHPLSQWKSMTFNYDKVPTIFLLYKNDR